MNKVILMGRIGQDIQLKQLPSGTSVANTSLATTKSFKDGAGEKQTQTQWHNILCFGHTANFLNKYCGKGDQILVEGEIQYREWEKQDGSKGYKTEILVEKIEFAGGSKKEENNNTPTPVQTKTKKREEEISIEDIPF